MHDGIDHSSDAAQVDIRFGFVGSIVCWKKPLNYLQVIFNNFSEHICLEKHIRFLFFYIIVVMEVIPSIVTKVDIRFSFVENFLFQFCRKFSVEVLTY